MELGDIVHLCAIFFLCGFAASFAIMLGIGFINVLKQAFKGRNK